MVLAMSWGDNKRVPLGGVIACFFVVSLHTARGTYRIGAMFSGPQSCRMHQAAEGSM